jgi:CelD/BcsL family acetyltransferase involved in cellulose biosynthesis
MTIDAPAAATATSALRLSVLSSFEETEPLRADWDALVARLGASAHLDHDSCAVWWKHYGRGRRLRVLALHDRDRLVGVLPFAVRRAWLGPVWLEMASLVGSDSTLVVHDVPVEPERAEAAFTAALEHLLEGERCDAVRLAPLSCRVPQDAAVRAATAQLGARASLARDAVVAPHTVFELPASFDAYLASLDKNHRGNYRRSLQALERTFAVKRDVVTACDSVETEFPRFKDLHDRQWRADNRLGHFGDWPDSEHYHHDLVRRLGPSGRARFVRLSVEHEPVSYQLCYGRGASLAWFLPARVADKAFERYSLGRVGLVQMIEHAIAAGFARIEGGIGHYDYKLQLGGTEYPVRSLVVTSASPWTRRRLGAYARMADALDLFYYRGWFQRMAPRLPLPRRPLSRTWIRSRL